MADHGHAHAAGHAADHHHGPTTRVYLIVAFLLTVITAVEVGIYYWPALKNSSAFVPILLVLSTIKFFTVVGFYMHLKYDHKLFRALFTGPLTIAIATMIVLLFLFGQLVIHAG